LTSNLICGPTSNARHTLSQCMAPTLAADVRGPTDSCEKSGFARMNSTQDLRGGWWGWYSGALDDVKLQNPSVQASPYELGNTNIFLDNSLLTIQSIYTHHLKVNNCRYLLLRWAMTNVALVLIIPHTLRSTSPWQTRHKVRKLLLQMVSWSS